MPLLGNLGGTLCPKTCTLHCILMGAHLATPLFQTNSGVHFAQQMDKSNKQISQETKLPTTMRNGLFGVKISGRLKDFPPRETAWRPAAMRNGLFRVKIFDIGTSQNCSVLTVGSRCSSASSVRHSLWEGCLQPVKEVGTRSPACKGRRPHVRIPVKVRGMVGYP